MSADYSSMDMAGLVAFMGAYSFVMFILAVVLIVAMWKIFTKAGEPGWASIIPLYNTYVLTKIAMGNGWFFLLMLIPVVNFIFAIVVYIKLAQAFGKGIGFGIGLILLCPIFILILAFGDAQYVGA